MSNEEILVDLKSFVGTERRALARMIIYGSAEELRGEKAGASLQVFAEQDGADVIFLRVTFILHR